MFLYIIAKMDIGCQVLWEKCRNTLNPKPTVRQAVVKFPQPPSGG